MIKILGLTTSEDKTPDSVMSARVYMRALIIYIIVFFYYPENWIEKKDG